MTPELWDAVKIVGNLLLAGLLFFAKRSFDELTSSVKQLQAEVTKADKQFVGIEKDIESLEDAVAELKKHVDELRREVHGLRDRLLSCPGCTKES